MFIRHLMMMGLVLLQATDGDGGGGAPGGGAAAGQRGATGSGASVATGAADAATGSPQAKPPAGLVSDDDDEDFTTPDTATGLLKPMTPKAFMRRVAQMTKKELRRLYGTDDVELIVKERGELTELRKYKTETEREKMTEREKLVAEKEESEQRALAAEQRAELEVSRAAARETNDQLSAHLSTLVDKADESDMLDKLARAVTKGGVRNMRQAKEWCEEYVDKHPKWKKSGGADAKADKGRAEPKAEPKAEPDTRRRVPLSTSRRPTKPSAGGQSSNGAIDFRTASKADITAATGYKL